MEFAHEKCLKCGAELDTVKPEKATECSKPFDDPFGRYVTFVAPCPSCGEDIPLWDPGEPELEAVEDQKPKPKAKKKS